MRFRTPTTLAFALMLALGVLWSTAASGSAATDFPWPPSPWAEWEATEDGHSSDPQGEPMATIVRKGRAASGAVALTFDDGYNRKACARITNILRKHEAVGTFFVNGQWLRREPERWRSILEGMEVANHTRSHRNLTREPHPVVMRQIRTNEAIHERVLGRPMLKLLRPPYGAQGERVGRIAGQLGYEHMVLWNVDTQDWRPDSKARRIIRRATDAAPGSIVRMHCARNATARALPAIVRHYQRRGIAVAGLSTVLEGARSEQPGKARDEGYGGA